MIAHTAGPMNGERRDPDDVEARRSKARANARLLALLALAFYVGFILLGLVKGIFPA
ncbi:MAG TPA: hypothetical protein VF329_09255 [Gammaproteobacteria bacterium]